MINETIKGIAHALDAEFGLPVTADSMEQGTENSFFVQLLQGSTVPFPNEQRQYLQPFEIEYFPTSDFEKMELYDIADRAEKALRVITSAENKVRGANWSVQIVDDVLQLFVSYNIILDEYAPTENMASMALKQATKEDLA